MMQGIDESVDAVFFVGYHARNGSANAILDHTWSSRTVSNVWLNDLLTGEYGLNAAVAGHFGVPVIMASGDQTACRQMSELLGEYRDRRRQTGQRALRRRVPAAAGLPGADLYRRPPRRGAPGRTRMCPSLS